MIVTADSSPLIVLVKIGYVWVLPALFQEVVIPPAVFAELMDARRPQLVRDFFAGKPAWLRIQTPVHLEPTSGLHRGEHAAISLAVELKAALLLIDETDGRTVARERQLAITGTIGILERAAESGIIDLKEAFERIKQTDFWIAPKLLDAELERHRAERADVKRNR